VFFIGCIWFNTPRLCRGSKFKKFVRCGIKADTVKKFPIQRQPLSAITENISKQKEADTAGQDQR
jgi:hypothetical protein